MDRCKLFGAPALVLGALAFPRTEPQEPPPAAIPLGEVQAVELDRHYRLVFFAVLEGLYQDGVRNDVVDALLRTDGSTPELFVWQCPICMPAYNAFRVYRERPVLEGTKLPPDTFGDGLSAERRARVLAGTKEDRFAVLNELVESWVALRLDAMRLSADERARWERGFEERRKKGMATLAALRAGGAYAGLESCALCDGATDACAAR